MPTLMNTLIDRLQSKPEEEQEEYAAMFLGELDAEEEWDELFADPRSHELLSRMAEEARREDDAGETEPISELFNGNDEE
jgi:hypothetical protein